MMSHINALRGAANWKLDARQCGVKLMETNVSVWCRDDMMAEPKYSRLGCDKLGVATC